MKKFLVLYTSSKSAQEQMAQSNPELAKKGMEAWMNWSKKAGSAIVDLGSPLGPIGGSNAKVGGFSILQADSAKAIEGLLEEHPHRMAPGASIEVHEFLPMPGM
jgi:hypothetical protein